jgi:uncharacterized protein (TIGR00369 family)
MQSTDDEAPDHPTGPASDAPSWGVQHLDRLRTEFRVRSVGSGRFRIALSAVGPATSTSVMELHPELLRPSGHPTAGVAAMLADSALATATVASLPTPMSVVTLAMTVDHLGAIPATGTLRCTAHAQPFVEMGHPQHAGGHIWAGDAGTPVAVVSAWFISRPVPGEPGPPGPIEEPGTDLHDLLDITEPLARDGVVEFALPVRESLSNLGGTLHGGVGALSSALAAEALLGPTGRLLTTSYRYLRPVPLDGVATVRAQIVRAGRRTATAEVRVIAPDGRDGMQATIVAAFDA